MASKPSRARVVQELRAAADAEESTDPHFNRFLRCPELQRASVILARAAEALVPRAAGSFTAATFTPLPSPPGWLPPPL